MLNLLFELNDEYAWVGEKKDSCKLQKTTNLHEISLLELVKVNILIQSNDNSTNLKLDLDHKQKIKGK